MVGRIGRLAPIITAAVLLALGAPATRGAAPTFVHVGMQISGPVVAGQTITFTPTYSDGFVPPSDLYCFYALRWGDAATLAQHSYNETFGSVVLRGRADRGYCGPWTVSLPTSASATWGWDFNFNFSVTSQSPYFYVRDFAPPGSGDLLLKGSNAPGASAGITQSSFPGIWLQLPSTIIAGDPITATAVPFGGYVQPPGGAQWTAGPAPEGGYAIAREINHSLTFTFTAPSAGSIVVAYNEYLTNADGRYASAVVDPRVRPRPTPVPPPAAPPPTPTPSPEPTPEPSPEPTPTPPPTLPPSSPTAALVALALPAEPATPIPAAPSVEVASAASDLPLLVPGLAGAAIAVGLLLGLARRRRAGAA